ncbi:MAG: trypsin-like peptidase domain-containing protein [Actinomycetota bacterium]|nr:trypsin-like peptidase domain-containing protein [Actinomycetota bacterium]
MKPFPTRTLPVAVALVASAMIGVGGGAATYAALGTSKSKTVVRNVTVPSAQAQPAAQTSSLSVNAIYRRSYKSVVEITVTQQSQSSDPFGGSQSQQATGSGFVYDSKGHIITNHHVVDGASSISVRFWNGASYKASLVGSDPSTDLAVIKVADAPSSLLAPLSLGDSSKVQVGDGVVAIGSPFGLEETVTSGIVSALHRQMTSPNNFAIDDSIQTDAAINHGNSGGPLINTRGQVIGVNAQIESDSGGNDGVGFAIPSNTIGSIASQLIGSGKAEHSYLGVSLESIPASAADRLGVPAGAQVTEVKSGTPAKRAGLHGASGSKTVDGQRYATGGDVITAVDGKSVASADELRAAIAAKSPGDTVTLTYTRGGASHTVNVKLASRPS